MPAVPANKPRDKVTPLPAPRASLSTAGQSCIANSVAKMPVKLNFCMINTVVLVWFLMTSWKEFMQAVTTLKRSGSHVPSLIPLLNHSVLSVARCHSFHFVRLKCLKKTLFLQQLSAYLNKSDCEIYWEPNSWLILKTGSKTCQGDGHRKSFRSELWRLSQRQSSATPPAPSNVEQEEKRAFGFSDLG